MITAFIIKATGDYVLTEIERGYKATDEIVGGDSEYVSLTTKLSLCCDDMGKAHHLPVNEKATQIMKAYLSMDDWIAGDAVVYSSDEGGDSCSLTEEQISEIEKIMEG